LRAAPALSRCDLAVARISLVHPPTSAEPYYGTPCVTEVKCNGPLPVLGRSGRLD